MEYSSELPVHLWFGFVWLTILTLVAFYAVAGRRWWIFAGGITWLVIAGKVAETGFFSVSDTFPPRLALLIIPMLAAGLFIGFSRRAKSFRSQISLEGLHYLHAVRTVVELVFLHGLYEAGAVAKALTYEGLNFDIVPGILLPLVGWFVFRRKSFSRTWAVVANGLGIAVLAWTVIVAVLSAPTAYQQFGVGAPTTAIFHVPFVWLPALVAPLMFWSHFIALGRMRDEGTFDGLSGTAAAGDASASPDSVGDAG